MVTVIRHKAASPPHMDGSIVFAVCHLCAPLFNTWFLGSTRVHVRKYISIRSAGFAGLTIVTD